MSNGGQFGNLDRAQLKLRKCAKHIAMIWINRFLQTMKMTIMEGLEVRDLESWNCVCVRTCVSACVCGCMCACMCACARVYVCVSEKMDRSILYVDIAKLLINSQENRFYAKIDFKNVNLFSL